MTSKSESKKSPSPNDLQKRFGKILKEAREASNLNLREAARLAGGICPNNLCNIERGRRSISFRLVERLLDAYDFSVSTTLVETGEESDDIEQVGNEPIDPPTPDPTRGRLKS